MLVRPVQHMIGAHRDVVHHGFRVTGRRPGVQARGAATAGRKAVQGLPPTMSARLSIRVAQHALAAIEPTLSVPGTRNFSVVNLYSACI